MKVYLIFGLDRYAEYDDEYYVLAVCSTKESAEKRIEKAKTEEDFFNDEFWWEEYEVE